MSIISHAQLLDMFLKDMHPNHKISYVRIPSDIPTTEVDGEKLPNYIIRLPCTLQQAIWYDRMA